MEWLARCVVMVYMGGGAVLCMGGGSDRIKP